MRTFGLFLSARSMAAAGMSRRRRRVIRPERLLRDRLNSMVSPFLLHALQGFAGRGVVGGEGEGGGILAACAGGVAAMQEKVSELEVNLECGSAIGLCGGGEVVT